jgi:transposase
MKKSQKNKSAEVVKLLSKQKIRNMQELDSYKLSICHPDSAGIDLGSREIYVALNPAIAAELDLPIVHTFSTFTSGLYACRDLLVSCGVTTVSMESTSVYWVNICDVLEASGIKVCLVNPKKFRMVPGRKTDVLDCQWLQTLHLYGLLSGSFHPESQIRKLRSYMRQREKLLQDRTRYVQRMQKALIMMNLMLVNVIDDITGKTGLDIIRAILQGERDPRRLAALRDGRVKKSEEEIAEALTCDYKEEQLFLLELNYNAYCFFGQQLEKIDSQITALLKSFPLKQEVTLGETGKPKKQIKKSGGKNALQTKENLNELLFNIAGVDLSSITGLQTNTILQIIAEVGTDMSKFPSAKHFASYLGFVPHNKITGGVIISSRTDRIKSNAAQAFKKVIPSISQGKSALACFYHRIASKAGTGKAVVAVCRKLAMIYYNVLTFGKDYVDEGQAVYKKKLEEKEKMLLIKLAKKHNMLVVQS